MTDHKLEIGDSTEIKDEAGTSTDLALRKSYVITSRNGLFKNGKQYKQGDSIDLDEKTARAFADAGDIEGDFDEKRT